MRRCSLLNGRRPFILAMVMGSFAACSAKEKEKLVYVDVPTEVIIEKLVNEKGEVISETIVKEVFKDAPAPAPALDVESAVVPASAGALALSTAISLIPPKSSDAQEGGSFSLFSTPYDDHEEEVVTWNQAQEPLDNVNNFGSSG